MSKPQALLQEPQSFGLSVVFTQALPHKAKPGAQASVTQALPLHFCPAAHDVPHAMQCCGSAVVSTQARPFGVGQDVGTEPAQMSPQLFWRQPREPVPPPEMGPPQTTSHVPQSSGSLEVSTHWPSQFVVPCGQLTTQEPLEHTWLPVQAWPQVPQFALLLERLTQSLPHAENPALQELEQVPLRHWGVPFVGVEHALLHEPQSATFVCVLMHWPLHLVNPAAHVKSHVPPLQLGAPFAGAVHTVPQVPQLLVSLPTLTHEPSQFVVPEVHVDVHEPLAHT